MIQQSLTRGIIPYSQTTQGGMYFGLSKYDTYKVAHFNVVTTTASQSITFGLAVKQGTTAFIDWGDGSRYTEVKYSVAGNYQNYAHTYINPMLYKARIINSKQVITLSLSNTSITGSITGMALTYLSLYNTGTSITGSITGMALTYLYLLNTGSAITGSITGMALTYLYLNNTSITGSITGMALTYLYLLNTGSAITGSITGMALTYISLNTGSAITGSITGMALTYISLNTGNAVTGILNISSRLTKFYYYGCDGTLVIPTTGLVFGASMTEINISNNTTGQPSDVIDAILNAAAATTWAAPKTIGMAGNNGIHTSASASALTTLAGLGVTVTVN